MSRADDPYRHLPFKGGELYEDTAILEGTVRPFPPDLEVPPAVRAASDNLIAAAERRLELEAKRGAAQRAAESAGRADADAAEAALAAGETTPRSTAPKMREQAETAAREAAAAKELVRQASYELVRAVDAAKRNGWRDVLAEQPEALEAERDAMLDKVLELEVRRQNALRALEVVDLVNLDVPQKRLQTRLMVTDLDLRTKTSPGRDVERAFEVLRQILDGRPGATVIPARAA